MPIHVIRYADYIETPWKNGGGVTHEIVRSDEGAEPDWRLSLATIDRDGPFSDFTGYDRTIVPLDGAGFELSFDDGETVELDRRWVPFRFTGERKVACRLLAGRSRDLNAMSLRARFDHDVTALALSPSPAILEASAQSFLFFSGAASVTSGSETFEMRDRDTLAIAAESRLVLRAATVGSWALAIRFIARG